jgi:glyceraldehyde-3-phosphate dehydrogenase type I
VLECTGSFDRLTDVQAHLKHGANKVLLSQPGQSEITAIVRGINDAELDDSLSVASAASCTTNAITPVIKVLDGAFGIAHGCITTIHSAMNDQPVLDAYHNTDLRKTRAAGSSMIPVETGLAAGIGRILPHLEGLFTAKALRIPTQNVSAMELTVQVRESVSIEAVNNALEAASVTEFSGLLGYSTAPLASCDFNHDPRSGIVDAAHTRVSGQLVNVFTWFDNEWAYANRMLELALAWTDQNDSGS